MAAAPILQYNSWADVHGTPERLLDFAQTLKTELSQQTPPVVPVVAGLREDAHDSAAEIRGG